MAWLFEQFRSLNRQFSFNLQYAIDNWNVTNWNSFVENSIVRRFGSLKRFFNWKITLYYLVCDQRNSRWDSLGSVILNRFHTMVCRQWMASCEDNAVQSGLVAVHWYNCLNSLKYYCIFEHLYSRSLSIPFRMFRRQNFHKERNNTKRKKWNKMENEN